MVPTSVVVVREWWLIALRGLFAIVFGLIAFTWPRLTIEALVLLFGAYALVDGATALGTAIWRAQGRDRIWHAIEAVLGVGAGVATFTVPGLTAIALLYVIAVWAMLLGILRIAIALRSGRSGSWPLALAGLCSLGAGMLLLLFPETGALALVWLIAANAVVFGAFFVFVGIRLRVVTHSAV